MAAIELGMLEGGGRVTGDLRRHPTYQRDAGVHGFACTLVLTKLTLRAAQP